MDVVVSFWIGIVGKIKNVRKFDWQNEQNNKGKFTINKYLKLWKELNFKKKTEI